MSRSLRKILFLAVGIIGVPFVLFVAVEISTLSDDEEMLEQIYGRQLESILFSVNQYSDDVVSNAANDIESNFNEIIESPNSLNPHTILSSIYFVHLRSVKNDSLKYWRSFTDLDSDAWQLLVDSLFVANTDLTKRLIGYQESGFRKIEPLGSIKRDQMDYAIMLYLLNINDELWYCITAIEPDLFTEAVLAPKMQEIAREDFVVLVRKKSDQSVIFSTDSLTNNELSAKSLWLIPDYEIAISPAGRTVSQIIEERTTINLILTISLGVLMILDFWLIFYNIKKEMMLAQNKSDFVSNVSHEIRTPLSLISMFAETLLLNRVENEEKKNTYYSIIQKESARLTRIINRILDFSKIEADKKYYNMGVVDTNEVVQQVVETYSFHLENNGFKYEISFSDQMPQIEADRESMVEAVINLIDNAIKYSDVVKKIEIQTGVENNYAFISVIDKGIGIDQRKKSQIFEKFYRITKNNVHDTKGVGLGLSLVKHIMDAHHGEIVLESAPGKGSHFKLLFPINPINQNV